MAAYPIVEPPYYLQCSSSGEILEREATRLEQVDDNILHSKGIWMNCSKPRAENIFHFLGWGAFR
jgi:hypothetical protein